MKLFFASLAALVFSSAASAECKLDVPVSLKPSTFDKTFPSVINQFTNVRLDKIPKKVGESAANWKNGQLTMRIAQIFLGAGNTHLATGYLGANVGMPEHGRIGTSELYIGNLELSGSLTQQNGYAIYTTEDSHAKFSVTTKVRAQRIESVEFKLPIFETDSAGKVKLIGHENVCVTSATPAL